jgi:hypothetical protein
MLWILLFVFFRPSVRPFVSLFETAGNKHLPLGRLANGVYDSGLDKD